MSRNVTAIVLATLMSLAGLGAGPAAAQSVPNPAESPEGWLLAFVDVETTGLVPGHHEMVDAGIVVTDLEGREVDRWFERILPRHPGRLSPEAAAINGFSVERWERLGAIPVEEAVEGITGFLREVAGERRIMMVAYNVSFDAAFLDHLYRAAGRDWREMNDTVIYYVLDLPSMAWSLGLRQVFHSDLPAALGIEPETDDPLEHTGLSGAEFNARVYRALLERRGCGDRQEAGRR